MVPPSRVMSPRQNLRCCSCQFHPGQTGKSRLGWRRWITQIQRSCGAILAKGRYVAGKTPIPIIAVSQLCITQSSAYEVFCRHVLPIKDDRYVELRRALRPMSNEARPDDPPLSTRKIRRCFGKFPNFLTFNLADQTALRVDRV